MLVAFYTRYSTTTNDWNGISLFIQYSLCHPDKAIMKQQPWTRIMSEVHFTPQSSDSDQQSYTLQCRERMQPERPFLCESRATQRDRRFRLPENKQVNHCKWISIVTQKHFDSVDGSPGFSGSQPVCRGTVPGLSRNCLTYHMRLFWRGRLSYYVSVIRLGVPREKTGLLSVLRTKQSWGPLP